MFVFIAVHCWLQCFYPYMTHWEYCYSINIAGRVQSGDMDELLSGTRSDGIFYCARDWLVAVHIFQAPRSPTSYHGNLLWVHR